MNRIEDLGEVISTDVLIIGGGISGLVAAIKAREYPVDVLIVERETVGWAGKAPKGGGAFLVVAPEDNLDKIMDYHVRNIGFYLEDQELLYSYLSESYGAAERLAGWGVKMARDEQGKLDLAKNPFGLWSLAGPDLNLQFPLRAKALETGATILNKVEVVELLKQGGRVVGAVGFNTIDGRFLIFKAKATILANGCCNYKSRRMWASGTGDGIAAAYRAGAEMRNAEFGNSCCDVLHKNTEYMADRRFLFNALGENISKRYEPEVEPDISLALVLGMEKEVMEGRGPLFEDLSLRPAGFPSLFGESVRGWVRPHHTKFYSRMYSKLKYGPTPSPRQEVTLRLHSELGPIKVDHDMKTTLSGLWAIGDASWGGSGAIGASPPPGKMRGSGWGNAVFTAMRGGKAAADYASRAASSEIDYSEVRRFKEETFAPMKRSDGLTPEPIIAALQEVVCPLKYCLRRSKDRLEQALSRVAQIHQRLPELCARDGHGLCKCHEAKSMVLCAEMGFRTALMRTESRGWHYREDYPERDDRNWVRWIVVRKEDQGMNLWTEPVPIEKFKIQPSG